MNTETFVALGALVLACVRPVLYGFTPAFDTTGIELLQLGWLYLRTVYTPAYNWQSQLLGAFATGDGLLGELFTPAFAFAIPGAFAFVTWAYDRFLAKQREYVHAPYRLGVMSIPMWSQLVFRSLFSTSTTTATAIGSAVLIVATIAATLRNPSMWLAFKQDRRVWYPPIILAKLFLIELLPYLVADPTYFLLAGLGFQFVYSAITFGANPFVLPDMGFIAVAIHVSYMLLPFWYSLVQFAKVPQLGSAFFYFVPLLSFLIHLYLIIHFHKTHDFDENNPYTSELIAKHTLELASVKQQVTDPEDVELGVLESKERD